MSTSVHFPTPNNQNSEKHRTDKEYYMYQIVITDDDTRIQDLLIAYIGTSYLFCLNVYTFPKPFHFPCVTMLKGVKIRSCENLKELFDQTNWRGAYEYLIDTVGGTGPAFLMYLMTLDVEHLDPKHFPREVCVSKIRHGMIDGSLFCKEDSQIKLEEYENSQEYEDFEEFQPPKKRTRTSYDPEESRELSPEI